MTNPLGFDALQTILHRWLAPLPDPRQQGPHTSDAIPDAALGAFGIFFTPSSSFLEYQRPLQQAQGHNNAAPLCGVEQLPCNHQIRHLLEPLSPRQLDGVSLEVFERLAQHGSLATWRVLSDQLFVARDGPQYHASQAMHCPNGLRRQRSHGPTLSDHSAIPPVIVCPGRSEVLALPPACIRPQDGHDKQDGERVAGKRWIAQHATQVAPDGLTVLGDDLSRTQPLCPLAVHHGLHCILVCQPDSHATLSKRVAFWQAHEASQELETRRWGGRFTTLTRDRSLHEVLLQGGQRALGVHGLEMTSGKAKPNSVRHNSC